MQEFLMLKRDYIQFYKKKHVSFNVIILYNITHSKNDNNSISGKNFYDATNKEEANSDADNLHFQNI